MNMYMAHIRGLFDTINWICHIDSHFMIILVQSYLKLFFQKKNMQVNLPILYDADERNIP